MVIQRVLTKPPVRLQPEAQNKLRDLAGDIDQAEKALDLMAELDMDVSAAKDKLAWAKKAREMLLREFV